MARPSNREKILTEGLKLVHQRGFGAASVRDIVQAAGVPQGSFTNHFASKEAFGIEILDIYFSDNRTVIDETLRNDALPPLARLGAYIDRSTCSLGEGGSWNGCLLGNFTAESGAHGEAIRGRLAGIFEEMRQAVAYCLRAAVAAGELPAGFDCETVAGFIVSSLQGAVLLARAESSTQPIERFRQVLFSTILR